MTRQRFPYLAILAISIARSVAYRIRNQQQPQRESRKRRARSLGLPFAEENHTRRRRQLGLHHLRLAHAPSVHLASNESNRPRCRLGKSCRRDSKHRRRARHRPCARVQPRLHVQRPRQHRDDFRYENTRRHRHRASGNEPRRHRLRPRFEARLHDEWTQLEFHRDRCRHRKSRWYNCAKRKA